MKLDRIDIRILHELQKNGRITDVEFLDTRASFAKYLRARKEAADGRLYQWLFGADRRGEAGSDADGVHGSHAGNHRQIDFARFQQAAEKVDEIIECHLISGGYDYLLKFVAGESPIIRR